MRTPRFVAALAVTGATATVLIASVSPASAQTAIGTVENFYQSCDASVYVTDSLIGSPGRIEAWGGYSCNTGFNYLGQLKIVLKNGNTTVDMEQKAVNASTASVNASVANASGLQNWHADLTIFRPGSDSTIVSTGVVRS